MVVRAHQWWVRKWPSIGLCVVPYRLFTCLHCRTSLILPEKVYLPLALWTDYIMSCVPVVVANSVGTCCGLHWIAFTRARVRSLRTAFKRVISWQKNASLRFFLSLWLLPLKPFSIILGNSSKLYQVSLSKCGVGILRDSSHGNLILCCYRWV